MSASNANQIQIGGDHYKAADGGEEHWDRCWRLKLDYFQSAITKYVERCWKKNGMQDLQKAAHYLQKYIELHSPSLTFQPTHRHAEGGLYRLLGPVQIHVSKDTWVAGVRYRDAAGKQYVRILADFDERMEELVNDGSEPGSGYTNQDR